MQINIELTRESIQDAIDIIDGYKRQLNSFTSRFVDELLSVGIKTARGIANSSATSKDIRGTIVFTTQTNVNDGGKTIEGLLIATDGKKIVKEWKVKDGTKSVVISQTLMAEFGSGWLSVVLDNVPGVGQGTFPGQTHANDPDGWRWTDTNGETHFSIGEAPSFPMHNAMLEMQKQIDDVAKRVFG